jgi:uncharacterized SAM-binding protein YcdF (DUF218 family)
MTPLEKSIFVVNNDSLKKCDAVVVLEGDGFNRISEGARLFKDGLAPFIIISGGINNPPYSYPAATMLPKLLELGIPENSVILEDKSMNTRDQAINIMEMAKVKGWKRIILVASHYHQYRAYATFLRAMQEAAINIEIINAPARQLSWFLEDEQGKRIDLLEGEFERIKIYGEKGHLASPEEILEYQIWKENQI